MLLHERIEYSPISERKPLKLPDGGRVIVWTVITCEVWDEEAPLPRTVLSAPGGQRYLPDVPNWTWAEYGMRVGFWRMKKIIDEFGIRATLCLNGSVCERYPQVVEAAKSADWEFMGHNYVQQPMHLTEDEEGAIKKTVQTIKAATGKHPRGWMGPGLTETHDTPEYLVKAGVEYTTDWVLDDQPCTLKTDAGPLYTIPYSVETNDVVMTAIQQQPSSEIFQRTMDQFDCLYAEGAENPRILAVCVHPYLSGVPHRIGYFRKIYETLGDRPGVLFWTGDQIIDWYKQQTGA